MRRLRNQLRFGGLAAVGTATLLLPLLTITPADAAIPKANLSITKLVSHDVSNEVAVPSDFIPALSGTSTDGSGHYALQGSGLRVWTDASGHRKAAEYFAVSGPLPATASLTWTGPDIPGQVAPGNQIVFDADDIPGNGNDYNILVGEPGSYGANWWLTGGSSATAKAADPSGPANTGNGSQWFGTLAQWKAALPTAQMYAGGFSLGSGMTNDGVIESIDYDGTVYTFTDGDFGSSAQAAPGDTVTYQLTVANAANAGKTAESVQVTDVLPTELTYVPGSLHSNDNGCAFAGQVLTCNAGLFPAGISSKITFKATLDDQISSAGLPMTEGHWVDVQKQEEFADIPADFDGEFEVECPAGFMASDGGLLLDAVDPGGFYSDVVIKASERVTGSPESWRVKVTNLGDQRAQGKIKATCLGTTVGASAGHTHSIVEAATGGTQLISAGDLETTGRTVTRTCPAGATPVAPVHVVVSGLAVIRDSYADGNAWVWMVDHSAGTEAWFGITCLQEETSEDAGHTATLELATVEDVITVAPETRAEGVMQCPGTGHAIVGGYGANLSTGLSLGKEPRGTNYMFRFYNDDWENSFEADIQVTCVGVRTTAEQSYYHVVNTALVTTTSKDKNSSDNTSSADVAVDGDPLAPAPSGIAVDTAGDLTTASGKTKFVNLGVKCTTACSFTVKVISGGDVVAKATKSLVADPGFQAVSVATTSKGKNLGAGLVNVKVKTGSGTSTFPVTLS